MVIGIDIDGTLTLEVEGHDYKIRTPNITMIHKVRQWYNYGHQIILFSSRREKDRRITMEWMKRYNVPFHKLILDKPKFDVYIDDVSRRPEEVLGTISRLPHSDTVPISILDGCIRVTKELDKKYGTSFLESLNRNPFEEDK